MNGEVVVPFEYTQIDITGQYIYAKNINEEITVLKQIKKTNL